MLCKSLLAFELLFPGKINFQAVQNLVISVENALNQGEYSAIIHVPESEKSRLKTMLNTFPGVIAVISPDGNIHIQKVCVP